MRRWPVFIAIILLSWAFSAGVGRAAAQDAPVQRLDGRIEPGTLLLYRAPDLRAGQTLTLRAQTTAGDLDPLLGVISGDVDAARLIDAYEDALKLAIASGQDPLEAVDELRGDFLLAWDDDSGGGLAPALAYEIPADGDYRVLVAGALSTLGGSTAGDFELLLGLDAPGVLEGTAVPTGDVIATLDREATPPRVGVQLVESSLEAERPSATLALADFFAGDTITARLEAPQGDWQPRLLLSNFAGKPLADGRGDADGVVTLEYTFPADARNSRLTISPGGGADPPVGAYRLLLGANADGVLGGEAEEAGRKLVREAIDVGVGVRLEQMIDVAQASEFIHVAAVLRMEWLDPDLAFNPESCNCDNILLSGSAVDTFFADPERRFPQFSFPNQQGNRWIQNRALSLDTNGQALYVERFTTNFQVDFDFRQYPLDTQTFFIRVDSLLPEEEFRFSVLPGFSVISPENGEDEFIFSEPTTEISRTPSFDGVPRSRYQFTWTAPRELAYYILQIFVPILLIIGVSWFTFFLKDYVRRIEVASGNLLLFIAFSFSLAGDYPRLGYMTFLDAVMATMFVVNALVVVYNVWMRRLEMDGRLEAFERVDAILDWAYPLIYVTALVLMGIWFF